MGELIPSLLESLEHEGRVPLAWVTEHAAEGDPLPAAWNDCDDPDAMIDLLRRLRDPHADTIADAVDRVSWSSDPLRHDLAHLASEVRRFVPRITLADVLALVAP